MALSYEPVLNGYNIWTAEVLIPVYGKRKDGSKYRTFMKKRLNYTDAKRFEQKTRVIDKKIALKPKCTYKELLNIIHNEGGYVDSEGIIHKGEAVNKTVEL